jgi:importin subunit alpha-1
LDAGEWEVKKEAAWAISNFCSGATAQQVRTLVSKKVIKPLCNMLECKEQRMITVCLEALRHILKHGQNDGQVSKSGSGNAYADLVEDADGLDKIEQLQEHTSQKVYELAVDIIEKFFSEEAGDDENFGASAGFFGAAQPFKSDAGAPQPFVFGGPTTNNSFNFQPQQQQHAAPFSFGGGVPVNNGGATGFSF